MLSTGTVPSDYLSTGRLTGKKLLWNSLPTGAVADLEGGGEVCTRDGKPLMKVAAGERLRIWWDSRGEADPTDEYRIQVGGPLALEEAEALMARLKGLVELPERVSVADGGTWRVLTGHFERIASAEPLLQRLASGGFNELWVSTEKRPGEPRQAAAKGEGHHVHPLGAHAHAGGHAPVLHDSADQQAK